MVRGLQLSTVPGVEQDPKGNTELHVSWQYVCLDYHNRLCFICEQLKRIIKKLDMRHNNSEIELQHQEIQADLGTASIESKPIPAPAVLREIVSNTAECTGYMTSLKGATENRVRTASEYLLNYA